MATRRLLLIDDEDDIREVAALSLETVAGWTVLLASTGEEGLQLAAAEHPDAILLDVMMPEIDGPFVYQRLQEDPKTRTIPVIFLTAKAQAVEQRLLLELGVAGVIAKPFDPLTLSGDISRILHWD